MKHVFVINPSAGIGAHIEKLKENFDVIQISKVYEGRGESRYSNVYIDVNNK